MHRRALLKNLATALIKHERIVTTLAKAKELRRVGDWVRVCRTSLSVFNVYLMQMVTLGKRNTEESKAEAERWMMVRNTCVTPKINTCVLPCKEHSLVPKLFGILRERYAVRSGGYTRLLRIPNRVGDNAKMAVIELVDNP